MRLILVRHGQVPENREMRYVGRSDSRLTDLGIRQVEALGDAVAALAPSRIRTSPLARCMQTAQAIGRVCALEPEAEEGLREQSFGTWEGLTRQEVRERSSADAECLARFDRDPDVAPPGGESHADVRDRVLEVVEELAISCASETVVLVSHVGPIKALFASALDIPLVKARRMFLDPATISVVDWEKTPFVRLFNSHSHLGWGNARWIEQAKRID